MKRTIYIDTTNCLTELCKIGAKYNTDKSPFATNTPRCAGHRKGFTGVYDMLFSPLKNKQIDLCEIGIEGGASLQTFSEYFFKANIYGMELLDNKIEECKNLNIPRTTILKTDASSKEFLHHSFQQTNKKFDIIIDDSMHITEHQLNIIEVAAEYLKPGGILIIEDLYRNDPENIFDSAIKDQFSFYTFIICHHDNRVSWDNDKIWYAIKK